MKKLAKGFTLLEMLLVLAVIALVAVMGLSTYQQRVVTFKVEKTALQMQMILEAAKAYNDNTGNWPSTNAQFANYLAGTPLNNCPWYDASTACYVPIPPTSTSKYQLTVTIPTSQSNYAQIAQMIAARLPNASVTGASNNVVTAAMPTSTSPTQIQQTVVKVASFSGCSQPYSSTESSSCPLPAPIPLLDCQSGYTRKVYFTASTTNDWTLDRFGDYNGFDPAPPGHNPIVYGHLASSYFRFYGAVSPQYTGTPGSISHVHCTNCSNPVVVPAGAGATVTPVIDVLNSTGPDTSYQAIRAVGLAIETCEAQSTSATSAETEEHTSPLKSLLEY